MARMVKAFLGAVLLLLLTEQARAECRVSSASAEFAPGSCTACEELNFE